MRADGKIWVVVGVIAIVFVGIITYLVLLDRKISKIEKSL
jgi:CcmD family protein